MNISIIDYNAGNVKSVEFALKRLGLAPEITNNKETILNSDKVIFPGVGEASSAMANLKQTGLDKLIPELKQPVLGICIGMQLMCEYSEEGDTKCMGIFPAAVKKFIPNKPETKVPHMGWNSISNLETPLFNTLEENAYVYFVHSYYAEKTNYTIAECNYILPYSAAMQRDNFYATQFHPEKSGSIGEQVLKNFIEM